MKSPTLFRIGDRANDGGKMMLAISRKMTGQESMAVAEYSNGLR